jgi:K+-sensing histidine kinase KdpD
MNQTRRKCKDVLLQSANQDTTEALRNLNRRLSASFYQNTQSLVEDELLAPVHDFKNQIEHFIYLLSHQGKEDQSSCDKLNTQFTIIEKQWNLVQKKFQTFEMKQQKVSSGQNVSKIKLILLLFFVPVLITGLLVFSVQAFTNMGIALIWIICILIISIVLIGIMITAMLKLLGELNGKEYLKGVNAYLSKLAVVESLAGLMGEFISKKA